MTWRLDTTSMKRYCTLIVRTSASASSWLRVIRRLVDMELLHISGGGCGMQHGIITQYICSHGADHGVRSQRQLRGLYKKWVVLRSWRDGSTSQLRQHRALRTSLRA